MAKERAGENAELSIQAFMSLAEYSPGKSLHSRVEQDTHESETLQYLNVITRVHADALYHLKTSTPSTIVIAIL